jgi:lipooligosaccharide transport system permease protein
MPGHPSLAVLETHLVSYRRTWRSSALTSFVLPLLMVVGFGVSVGAYVRGGVGGVSYLDWLVPGLLASTAMQVAVGASTWRVMGAFQWSRTYHAQIATPVRVSDLVAGQLWFTVFRVFVSAVTFLLVAVVFGAVHSAWAVAALPVAVLLGVAVAAPTLAFTASVKLDSYLALFFRFVVLPTSLFAGVFFPVETLPAVLRWVAYATPLWHGVELCRAAMLGAETRWPVAGHLAYLAVWASAGWWLAVRRYHRRLVT